MRWSSHRQHKPDALLYAVVPCQRCLITVPSQAHRPPLRGLLEPSRRAASCCLLIHGVTNPTIQRIWTHQFTHSVDQVTLKMLMRCDNAFTMHAKFVLTLWLVSCYWRSGRELWRRLSLCTFAVYKLLSIVVTREEYCCVQHLDYKGVRPLCATSCNHSACAALLKRKSFRLLVNNIVAILLVYENFRTPTWFAETKKYITQIVTEYSPRSG